MKTKDLLVDLRVEREALLMMKNLYANIIAFVTKGTLSFGNDYYLVCRCNWNNVRHGIIYVNNK